MRSAYAYLRVSGKGQVDGDGFTRQLEAIRAFAKVNDIRIVKVFREEGVSGAKEMDDRPALAEMLIAMLGNGVKLVLVERLDRLARDLMIQENLLRDLRKRGLDLISVAEPDLCSADPTRTLLRQFIGAIAQYEKSMIVLKLRGARERMRKKTGRCEGAKAYGTKPGEAAVVQRILDMHKDALSLSLITQVLNREGIKPRRGTVWYPATVRNIINRQKKNS